MPVQSAHHVHIGACEELLDEGFVALGVLQHLHHTRQRVGVVGVAAGTDEELDRVRGPAALRGGALHEQTQRLDLLLRERLQIVHES